MMSEISQTETNKHCKILLICGIKKKTKPEAKLRERTDYGCQRQEQGVEVGKLDERGQRYTLPVIR